MREGPFGLPWFGRAALGILTITALFLVGASVYKERQASAASAVAASEYVPPTSSAAPSASTSPLSAGRSVAFIGDSYTVGSGASAPAKGFAQLVAAKEGWRESNFGRGGTGYVRTQTGDTARQGCGLDYCPTYAQMLDAVAASKPQIVFVSGGRNDEQIAESTEKAAIQSFYKALRAKLPNAAIVATSPVWDNTSPPFTLKPMQAEVRAAVSSVKGRYLDIGEPLSGHASWISADHVHPNDQGHAALAAAIEKALP